jgi:hypothetical protein
VRVMGLGEAWQRERGEGDVVRCGIRLSGTALSLYLMVFINIHD